ncbi:MAG: RNA methyltransferase [Peptococcaceae bacterium]|nr:RNA methyltransferase [Peptococcaceae bacterium]
MITSLQNEQVKQVVALHKNKGRSLSREYLVEGKRFVREALLRKAKIRIIYFVNNKEVNNLVEEASLLGITVQEVSGPVMKKMAATEEPQGILAVISMTPSDWPDIFGGPEKAFAKRDDIMLILDNIQDPGNLGTILRTALAADVRRIILTKGTVDLYNPKVLRSSMGAIFSQTILTNKEPAEIVNFCHQHNFILAVSTMDGESVFAARTKEIYPLALVIGNEATGVSEFLVKKAGKKFSIPMFNQVDSLNAAMATGIFLYELRRQQGFL